MNTTVIRPGILVSLKSTVTGGVNYQRTDIEKGTTDNGGARARWETTRVIEEPAEHDRAVTARGRALLAIRRICAKTSFGLLCPEERAAELTASIDVARAMTAEHNASAKHTRVQIYVLMGRIASTDEEAARAVGEEVRGLIDDMNLAIDRLDVDAIRKAANSAREMAAMLSDAQQEKVADAVVQARKAARMIVQRIEKDGEAAAIVLADIQRGSIQKARIAFMDFEEVAPESAQVSLPAVTLQRFDFDAQAENTHGTAVTA